MHYTLPCREYAVYTVYSTVCSLQQYAVYGMQYAGYSTVCSLQQYAVYGMQYAVYSTVCSMQYTVCSMHYTSQYAVCSIRCAVYSSMQCTVCSIQQYAVWYALISVGAPPEGKKLRPSNKLRSNASRTSKRRVSGRLGMSWSRNELVTLTLPKSGVARGQHRWNQVNR